MKQLLPIISISLFVVLFILSCKKDLSFEKRIESDNSRFPGVSFDPSYNVLVFDGPQAIINLEEEIRKLESNFPYNRGNTTEIMQTIIRIKSNGSNNGNGAFNSKKVSLKDFKELLSESHPLSDSILIEIVNLSENNKVNPPFV